MKKRLLSILMVLCLAVSLVTPVVAVGEEPITYTDGTEDSVSQDTENPVEDSTPQDTETTTEDPSGEQGTNTPVARIGPQEYDTLDAAVAAATDGTTIELLANATTNGLNLSKNLTIQAATGLEVRPTVTFNQYGIALWGKNLTFKNIDVEMNGIGSTPYTGEWSWMTICASTDASLTLDNVNMTMDATGTTNSPHAIYFCNNNVLNIINGSNLTIKNYGNDALEWDGGNGGYNVNITDSTFVSDHNRSGFTGTFYATITNSKVDVINSTGNGSNGSHFIITESTVNFNDNQSHGLSAANLTIDNSTVTANGNGICGIIATGRADIKNNSVVTVKENEVACAVTSRWSRPGAVCFKGEATIAANCTVTITDNQGSGIYLWDEDASLTMETGVIQRNTAQQSGCGGGIYNEGGTVNLSSAVQLYNNHATTAGDDIYNADVIWRYDTNTKENYSVAAHGTLTFSPVGSNWALDGAPDCTDAIDGWYDDSEGSRWNAHSVPTHVDEFTVGSAAVHDLLALKAAHGVIPLEPGDEQPDYDHSKSKTATNLEKQEDGTYTSQVTLSLPSAEEELTSDIVFVLDYSSCQENVTTDALAMLGELNKQVTETNATITIGAIVYRGTADERIFPLQSLTDESNAALADFFKEDTGDLSPGSNMHAGLLAAQEMLSNSTTNDDRKYLVLISDGITYTWEQNGQQYGANYFADGNERLASNSAWEAWYGDLNWVPENGWDSYLDGRAEMIQNTLKDRTSLYDRTTAPTNCIAEDERDTYANCVDVALYKCREVYRNLQENYNCYAFLSGDSGQYGASFINYLANEETVSFDEIQKDIYYLVDAGTTVEDYMGYVADDYNFDFVADGLTMKVGDQTYEAVCLEDNKYGFVPNEENAYAYTLTYVPGDQKGSEHFVWEINVPVSNFAPVQLTYTVKLVNPKTAEGTYGQYDADGSEGLDSLYTNNSATLYPMDSNNTAGIPENFPKPTVSYTVAQETGALTVQKLVADNVEDWSFDFTATIGDKTEKFTLTKNAPTKTFDSIPLDTQYTVKEDNSGKYQVTSTNATGTITENSSAVFVNMPVDTGVLTISKTVEGQKNPTEKFTFTVNLPEGEYPYIYSTAQGNDEVSGHISNNETVTLSSGQSVSIYGLPVGASYTVTETANDDYTVSAEAIHGTVDGAVVSGTIPDLEDGAAAAHYTNTYHGSWIPPVDPDPTPDPDPGDKPELNTEDHYAYIVGYEDGSVQPEGDITRAEVATIFFRLLTDESRNEFWSQTNNYTDVPADAWYNNAVSTLTNAGIIDGYEDGTFKPDGNITRAEFATIAVRFFEATYDGGDLFSDIAGHWAQDYINEAANAGIVDGYPDGTFRPQQYITRAEAMTMVNRTIDRHPHKDHLLADMIVWPDNPETAWYYEQVQEATNSHEYTMNTDDEQNPYEIWTNLLPNRDWSELEKEWSDANDGAGSGEVV